MYIYLYLSICICFSLSLPFFHPSPGVCVHVRVCVLYGEHVVLLHGISILSLSWFVWWDKKQEIVMHWPTAFVNHGLYEGAK